MRPGQVCGKDDFCKRLLFHLIPGCIPCLPSVVFAAQGRQVFLYLFSSAIFYCFSAVQVRLTPPWHFPLLSVALTVPEAVVAVSKVPATMRFDAFILKWLALISKPEGMSTLIETSQVPLVMVRWKLTVREEILFFKTSKITFPPALVLPLHLPS